MILIARVQQQTSSMTRSMTSAKPSITDLVIVVRIQVYSMFLLNHRKSSCEEISFFFSMQIYVVHTVIPLSAFMSYGWSSAFLGSSRVAAHDRLIGIGVLLLLLANQSHHLQIAMFMWTD